MVVTEPSKLWNIANGKAGLTYDSFQRYFKGKLQAVGIKLRKVHILDDPIELNAISENLQAPQSYRYLTKEQFMTLME